MDLLTVIIPCRNEAFSIPEVIRDLAAAFKESSIDCTILVIDDGSLDHTGQAALGAGRELETKSFRVRVVELATCSGKDSAILCGMDNADRASTWIAVMDGDGQHPADSLRKLVECAQAGSPVTVADPKRPRGQSAFRRLTHVAGQKFLSRQSVQTDFSVISCSLVGDVTAMMRAGDAYRDALTWLAAPVTAIRYEVQARTDGSHSRFTLTDFVTLGSRRALSRGREIVIALTVIRLATIFVCAITLLTLYLLGALTWPMVGIAVLVLLLVAAANEVFVVFVLLSVYARGTPRPRYQLKRTYGYSPDQ